MYKSKLASENQIDELNLEFNDFYKEINNFLILIEQNDANSKNLLVKAFEKFNLLKKLFDLNKEILPQYTLKVNQEKINFLQIKLIEKKELINPRQKFKFSSSKITNENENKKKELLILNTNENKNSLVLNSYGFKDKVSEILTLNKQDSHDKDIQLCNLVDCKIYIYGNPNTLHILNCSKCQINSGPVPTSVMVNDCTENIFQLFCQQLRVHNTKNCTFYLHVTTKAIIEDSTELKFCKYNWSYENLEEDILNSNLNVKVNNWNKIIDFNWLSSNKKSLNWIAIE